MLAVGLFVGWTLFVWVGRIRNAMTDPDLADGGRTGPLLLALSFVVPAVVVGVLAFLARPSVATGDPAPRSRLRAGVQALAAWTTGVWIVRVVDIAFGGDHPVGFVVVHTVLGVVSVALAALAVRAVRTPDGPLRSGTVSRSSG